MDLFAKRLLFTMGKGGVGKSAVSCALTRLALERGKKLLLVQVNTQDKTSMYLGTPPADENVREVFPNLFSVNIQPPAALKEYVLLQVRLEMIYRLVFENRAVKYFLRAVPALNDLVVLGKIYYHVMQKDDAGQPLYDLVIVDAPATGHGLQLLRLPEVMIQAVQRGPVFREATNMLAMLRDPAITAINLVTLPEEMPVAESLEMYEKIRDELHMPMGYLFINGVYEKVLDESDEQAIERIATTAAETDTAHSALKNVLDTAKMKISWRKLTERFLSTLRRDIPLPTVELPYIFAECFDGEAIERMSRLIEQGMVDR